MPTPSGLPPMQDGAKPAQDSQRVPNGADQARSQEAEALEQMGQQASLQINEGGRTNDSHETQNPDGAVHGLPKPALKGTWR